jgi:succinyl-CoA synthetase alpha subunit
MSILVDGATPVLIQGITGTQGRRHTEYSLDYGTNIVAGVTPGKAGEDVRGIPVFDAVADAVAETGATATVLYVPARAVPGAVEDAIAAGIKLIVGTSEGISRHQAAYFRALTEANGARLVGFNTTGVLSAGKAKLGGIGGEVSEFLYPPGRIGVCSRSGGLTGEISLAMKQDGYGVSTALAMGGDWITGTPMVEYVRLFEADPDTDAIILFGEPGTDNELEVAEHLVAHGMKKPVIALLAGRFQENYPPGISFGHAAAMIGNDKQTITAKAKALTDAGATVISTLEEVPKMLRDFGIEPSS